MNAKIKAIAIGFGLILIVSLLFGAMAFQGVGEGEVKVVKQHGAVTGETLDPGWHFITPIRQSTETIPVRPQAEHIDGDESIYVITHDGQDVWVDVTIRYRVDSEQAPIFHTEYRNLDQANERLIYPTLRSNLRDEASDMSAREIITRDGRLSLEQAAQDALTSNFDGSGLVLEAVQVRGIELNQEFATALENVEIEETRAEQQIIAAQADADAYAIRGEAIRQNPEVLTEEYIRALDDGDTIYIPIGDDGLPIFLEVEEPEESE